MPACAALSTFAENPHHLLSFAQAMESSVIDHGVCLIVVDSIAALARTEFDGGQGVDRAQQLGQLASALKYLAETFRIPVVVTNQVGRDCPP